jgi:hypothetical protein
MHGSFQVGSVGDRLTIHVDAGELCARAADQARRQIPPKQDNHQLFSYAAERSRIDKVAEWRSDHMKIRGMPTLPRCGDGRQFQGVVCRPVAPEFADCQLFGGYRIRIDPGKEGLPAQGVRGTLEGVLITPCR